MLTPLEQGILRSGENHSNVHRTSVELLFFGENVMELNLNVDGSEQRFPALFLLQGTRDETFLQVQ